MKVKPKKQLQVLTNSDREPEIVRVAGDRAVARIFFNIDMAAALEAGVISCSFRVLPTQTTIKSKQRLGALDSSVSLGAPTARKLSAQNRRASVVVDGNVDITKSMPNDRVRDVLSGGAVRARKIVKLSDQGDDDSIDSPNVVSSTADQVTKSINTLRPYRLDSIHLNSLDPAGEVNLASFHKPAQTSIKGLRVTDNLAKLNTKQQLFRKNLQSKTSTMRKLKLEDEIERSVEIPCTFHIEKSKLSKYVVEVDAVSKTNPNVPPRVLQTIKFDIDLREAYEEFIIPTIPPTLDISSVGSARFIRATQRDRNGKRLRIYRRIVETTEETQEPFTTIADVQASFGETVQFVDRPDSAGKCIYRVVTLNELSMTSGEFSSSVTRGARAIEKGIIPDTTAILATEDSEGIRVRAFNIPNDVIAVRILRRSPSLHEKEPTTPITIQVAKTKAIQQLDRSGRMADFRDRPARSGIVYEYFMELIDVKGNSRRSSKSALVRYVGDSGKTESYRLVASSQVASLDPNPKVSFQVEAPNDEASLNSIYEILSSAGLESQYVDEIKQNRELFNKIAALEMLRFDTVTGLNESFGVVQTGLFEDSSRSRDSKNVSAPVQGRTYIYQFRLLLRASSTLFDSALVTKTDLETNRQYTTAMKKFSSPKVTNRGTLSSTAEQLNVVSKTGLKLTAERSSAGEMLEGITALVGELQVTVPTRDTSLSNIQVESSPRGNIIRWKISQGIQVIDHIVIFADYNGTNAPLRSIHFTDQTNMMYLDDKIAASLDDVGYYIQPIFVDFSEGALVGPAEF